MATDETTTCQASLAAGLERLLGRDRETITCPYPLYAELRRDSPVEWSDQLGCFIVTRYDDIVEVLRNPQTFSSRMASGPHSVTGLAEKVMSDPRAGTKLRQCAARRLRLNDSPVLLVSDPPEHKRQRSLVSLAFTPRRVKLMEPDVRQIAADLAERAVESGHVDFVRDFAIPLPMTVIAKVMGVPTDRLADFKRWSDAFTHGVGSLDPSFEQIEALFFAVDEFYDYFTEQLELRRSHPRDDLLTDLLSARLDGTEPLSMDEMLQMLSQFLVGGNETTTSLLGWLMRRLASDRDLFDAVQADYDVLGPLAEEMLRLETPVQGTYRLATCDTQLAGHDIPAGSMLWLVYGSANRDAAGPGMTDDIVLEGAQNRQHLAFGRGEHYCLGAAVARLEVRVGMEALLSRLQRVELATDAPPSVLPSFVFHGQTELPLRLFAKT